MTKRGFFQTWAIAVLGGALLAGCSSPSPRPVVVTPTGEIYVRENPPSPRTEDIGMAPSSADVWVQGYWSYHDARWVWIPGHWQTPPQQGENWVAGHWDHSVRGWVFTPGHWE